MGDQTSPKRDVINKNNQTNSPQMINFGKGFQKNQTNQNNQEGVQEYDPCSNKLSSISDGYFIMLSEKINVFSNKIINILFKTIKKSSKKSPNYCNVNGLKEILTKIMMETHNTTKLKSILDIFMGNTDDNPLLQFYEEEEELNRVKMPKSERLKLASLATNLYWILRDHDNYKSFTEYAENWNKNRNPEGDDFYNLNKQNSVLENIAGSKTPPKKESIKKMKGVGKILKQPWYKRFFFGRKFKSKSDENLYEEITTKIESINLKLKEFNKTKMSENSKFELLNEMNILSNIWFEKLHQSGSFHKSFRDAIANLEQNLGLNTFSNDNNRCPVTGVPLTESNQNRLFISRSHRIHSLVLFFLGKDAFMADMVLNREARGCCTNHKRKLSLRITKINNFRSFSKNDFMAFNLTRQKMLDVIYLLKLKEETPCDDIKFNFFNGYFCKDKIHNKNCLGLAQEITKIIGFNIDPNVFLAKGACKYQNYSVEDNMILDNGNQDLN